MSSVRSAGDLYSAEQVRSWLQGLSSRDYALLIEETSSFVALEDDVVIGYANLIPRGPGDGELALLYVRPDYHRQGCGRVLVEAVEREARAGSMRRLWVDASLLAAPLLETMGFQVVERRTRTVDGVDFANTWLVKRLPA